MLFKKQKNVSIIISIGLSLGIIAITSINVFAKSTDYVMNTETEIFDEISNEGIGENTDDIQNENTDDSSYGTQDKDAGGSSGGTQDEDIIENPDGVQDGEVIENPDGVQDGDAIENPDEILDPDAVGEIEADLPDENILLITDEDISNAAKQTSDLSISIEYPDQIQCNTPTIFTVNADGGSGDYLYRIHSLTVFDGSEYVSVYMSAMVPIVHIRIVILSLLRSMRPVLTIFVLVS